MRQMVRKDFTVTRVKLENSVMIRKDVFEPQKPGESRGGGFQDALHLKSEERPEESYLGS